MAQNARANGGKAATSRAKAQAVEVESVADPVSAPVAPAPITVVANSNRTWEGGDTGTHPGIPRVSRGKAGRWFTVKEGMLGPFQAGDAVHEDSLGGKDDREENIERLLRLGVIEAADKDAASADAGRLTLNEALGSDSPPTLPNVAGTTATEKEGYQAAKGPSAYLAPREAEHPDAPTEPSGKTPQTGSEDLDAAGGGEPGASTPDVEQRVEDVQDAKD